MLTEQPLLVLYNIINRLDNKSIYNLSETCRYFSKLTEITRSYIRLGLEELCIAGNLEGIKYLVSQGDDVTDYALIRACQNGHLEVVKYILSLDIFFGNNWAVAEASKNGHLEVVKCLVWNWVNITDNNHAVKLASENGHLEVVKYLVSKGVNITDNNGYHAVISASKNNHLKIVNYLISQGARYQY